MAKKKSKKKVSKKKSAVKPKAVRVPAVVGRVRNIACKLDDVTGLPNYIPNLTVQRDKLVASIDRFATRIEKSYVTAAKNAERAKAKAKRDVEKAARDKIKATAKAKRDAAKAERVKATNARKADKIRKLREQITKLENG